MAMSRMSLRWGTGAMSAVMMLSQGVFAYKVESGFWAQRLEASRRLRASETSTTISLRDVPLGAPPIGSKVSEADTKLAWTRLLARHGTFQDAMDRNGGTVFHIQDVHGHAEAQKNIAAIVAAILDRHPKATVLLEGAAGPIPLSQLRPDKNPLNSAAAGFFFQAGLLTGAEAAVFGFPGSPSVSGAEDRDTYVANRRALDAAHAARAGWKKKLADWRAAVEGAKKNIYSPNLQALDHRSAVWQTDGGFSNRARFLASTPELQGPAEGSALWRFVRILDMEKALSMEKASRERTALMEELTNRMSPREAQGLAEHILAVRSGELTPGDFYGRVIKVSDRCGVRMRDYPSFDSYTRYVAMAESIRPDVLEKEMNEREEKLWAVLALSPKERALRVLDESVRDWERLTDLSMTPEQWRDYLKRSKDQRALAETLRKCGLPALSCDGLEPFEQFFRYAELRNQALAEKAWTATQGGEPVILVAGGFHNAGVGEILSARGIHFVTVTPKLGDIEDGVGGPFDLFFRDRTPLEQLFQSPRITLVETSSLSPLTEDGVARAEAVRSLTPPVLSALSQPGVPQAASSSNGTTIVVAANRGGALSAPSGVREVIGGVSASISGTGDAPVVSVFHRNPSFLSHGVSLLVSQARLLLQTSRRALGVGLMTAFLLPLAAVSPAHAYTLVQSSAGTQVFVDRGEHLWGAATTVLKAEGIQKPANAQIAAKVKEMVALNHLKDPNIVHPNVQYKTSPQAGATESLKPSIETTMTGQTGPGDSNNQILASQAGVGPTLPLVSGAPESSIKTEIPPAPVASPPITSSSKNTGSGLSAGIVTALAGAVLILTAWSQRAYSQPPLREAAAKALKKIRTVAREVFSRVKNLAKLGADVVNQRGKRRWMAALALVGLSLAAGTFIPGLIPERLPHMDLGVFGLNAFLAKHWPVLATLGIGLTGAAYFVWIREKAVDLSSIEKNDTRIREWTLLLYRLERKEKLNEEDLSSLANNVHALVLNYRLTAIALSDRGPLEKRIEVFRAIARLAERTVRLFDQRLAEFPSGNDRDRLVDIREKFFLYQLYGLKASHALVPASVAHWALSNFDSKTSWFEKRKMGTILRFVRGIGPMFRKTVAEFQERMLTDDSRPAKTLWERAEGLSVVSLGNILIPGLYIEKDKSEISQVFKEKLRKTETLTLSDGSASDLHRKGWGTLISLLLWSVAISLAVSVYTAVLAFLTGLGVTMALFRLQALGTRRDGFFRSGLATWKEMNKRPHTNGRLGGNGDTAGEDPFHLNRDFARFHFHEAERALSEETSAEKPATDIVLLIAQNEEQKQYFESRSTDRSLFAASVPVVVLTVPKGQGSFTAYARAWTYLFSDEVKALALRYPHLAGRDPWTLNAVTLAPKGETVEGMSHPLSGLPQLNNRLGGDRLNGRTIFDLAVMNAFRAMRARQGSGEQGGMALRWADRAYVGPIRVAPGAGMTLDTQWVNTKEMEDFNFGAVLPSLDRRRIKLFRRPEVVKTLGRLQEDHSNRVYDMRNPRLKQIQAFSGEGFFALDAESGPRHHVFLADMLTRREALNHPPLLNLMTYYLVPLSRAQSRDSATAGINIAKYFSDHGFFTNPHSEDVQSFNLQSANRLSDVFQGEGNPRFSLNEAFVDESLYASKTAAGDIDEEEFDTTTTPPSEPGYIDRIIILLKTTVSITQYVAKKSVAAFALITLGLSAPPVAAMEHRILPDHFLLQQSETVVKAMAESVVSLNERFFPVNPVPSVDVTERVWEHPEETVSALTALLPALRRSDHFSPAAEQALTRLLARAASEVPLSTDLSNRMSLPELRAHVARAEKNRERRLARRPARAGGAGRARINKTIELSLAHQIAQAWRTSQSGASPLAELAHGRYVQALSPSSSKNSRALFDALDGLWNVNSHAGVPPDGSGDRKRLFSQAIAVPVAGFRADLTMIRVTEFLTGPAGAARQALEKYLLMRASQFKPGTDAGDVFIVNGRNGDDKRIKDILRATLPGLSDDYLKACRTVVVPRGPFAPETAIAALPSADKNRSVNFLTVDPASILLDPLRDSSYRVLLLEWAGGDLKAVDLLDIARQALKAARVVASKA